MSTCDKTLEAGGIELTCAREKHKGDGHETEDGLFWSEAAESSSLTHLDPGPE